VVERTGVKVRNRKRIQGDSEVGKNGLHKGRRPQTDHHFFLRNTKGRERLSKVVIYTGGNSVEEALASRLVASHGAGLVTGRTANQERRTNRDGKVPL
jgi:hypothetical protein